MSSSAWAETGFYRRDASASKRSRRCSTTSAGTHISNKRMGWRCFTPTKTGIFFVCPPRLGRTELRCKRMPAWVKKAVLDCGRVSVELLPTRLATVRSKVTYPKSATDKRPTGKASSLNGRD